MAQSNTPHKGHRDRMRKKFLLNELDGFETHEALELLLYYAVPRKDTNPIAHRLLERFGSLSAVLDAPVNALTEAGLSQNAAVLLKLVPGMCRLYLEDKHDNMQKVINEDNMGELLLNKFIGREYEAVVLMLLDAKYKELFCGVISKGSVSACELYIRKIVQMALSNNAKYAVLAHNHPSGVALPSKEDLEATKDIYEALALVDVRLIDHIVVADNDYVSMSQSGIMKQVLESEK